MSKWLIVLLAIICCVPSAFGSQADGLRKFGYTEQQIEEMSKDSTTQDSRQAHDLKKFGYTDEQLEEMSGKNQANRWKRLKELGYTDGQVALFQNQEQIRRIRSRPIQWHKRYEIDYDTVAEREKAYLPLVQEACSRYRVDLQLVRAVIRSESGWNQGRTSPKGAIGLMQLMPDTAADLGVNPYDAAENIDGGVRLLSILLERFDGNERLTLAAYNAGPGSVDKFGGVPPYAETQEYVAKILRIKER